jgi:phospholipase/carboxylesterase
MLQYQKRLPKNGEPVKSLVVFIHGYGADGDDLITIADDWKNFLPNTAFISPHAPEPCESNPFGYQWFGLSDFSFYNIRFGLDRVNPMLTKFLYTLLNEYNLPPSQLMLVGFSQGTMVSLDILFSMDKIAGVLGYSGAFYPPVDGKPTPSPVCLIHGDMDVVVPAMAMDHAETVLQSYGVPVQTHLTHGLGHGIDHDGIELGGKFIKQCLLGDYNA